MPELSLELVSGLYHEWVEGLGASYEKPDLVVAFNSGAHTADSHQVRLQTAT